jgi:hypothetical protein
LGNACKKYPKTLNRHGLIAGYWNRKNKKLFRFYLNSYLPLIPVLMMDIKGDFSGIAKEGEENLYNGAMLK